MSTADTRVAIDARVVNLCTLLDEATEIADLLRVEYLTQLHNDLQHLESRLAHAVQRSAHCGGLLERLADGSMVPVVAPVVSSWGTPPVAPEGAPPVSPVAIAEEPPKARPKATRKVRAQVPAAMVEPDSPARQARKAARAERMATGLVIGRRP